MKLFSLLLGHILLMLPFTSSGQQSYYQYQPITMDFAIAPTSETASINPFTDYRLQLLFYHGDRELSVPGFYAADGNAAESSAASGGVWRVIFTPDQPGEWKYEVSFKTGPSLATNDDLYAGENITPHHGKTGTLTVQEVPAEAEGFASSGRLSYNQSRYLYTLDGKPFLKFGTNSPENFLAYRDIDGTYAYDPEKSFIKTWEPHVKDWKEGDPTWKNGKGKGIIGALNYLSSKKMNVVYALSLNIEGDARDVWPFLTHEKRNFRRYDVSKLAQWDIIFSHAEKLGIVMNVVTQEKENELILDDGYTGPERKLYYRELIARFGYHNNIIWNMGEENGGANFWPQGQSDQQRFAMIRYLKDHDPYKNPLVIHTHSESTNRDHVLDPLLAFDRLDGLSMQVANIYDIHQDFKEWIHKSEEKGRVWIMMMDEIGMWHTGTRTDEDDPQHDTLRQEVLWGTLMAGGTGVEWYFGWNKPPNDLNAEDWRSRNNIWEQSAVAHHFFNQIPYTEMKSSDELINRTDHYCFSKLGSVYVVYLKKAEATKLDLREQQGSYSVSWYNPRSGGDLQKGSITEINGGSWQELGDPPSDASKDWAILIQKK